MTPADVIADLWEEGGTAGIIALQVVVDRRPLDPAARAILPDDVLVALSDPFTLAMLRREFVPDRPPWSWDRGTSAMRRRRPPGMRPAVAMEAAA